MRWDLKIFSSTGATTWRMVPKLAIGPMACMDGCTSTKPIFSVAKLGNRTAFDRANEFTHIPQEIKNGKCLA